MFTPTFNVTENTDLVFRLRVNDTRFDTDDMVTVQLYPMVDSDGDGLSDQEEITGLDNSLTVANPGGQTTNPNVADSDGDGWNDGQEATAGTDPNSAESNLHISSSFIDTDGLHLIWVSVPGKMYRVQRTSALGGAWNDWGNAITAGGTSIEAVIPDPGPVSGYFQVIVVP